VARGAARARPARAAKPRSRAATGKLSWRWRAILLVVAAAGLAAAYFGWLRDSSLVAVNKVQVTGVTSDARPQIVAALTRAGEDMTTLHVRTGELEAAVAQFPTVAGVSADPNFPHGLTITVNERPATMVAVDGGERIAVAADGTVLPGVDASDGGLPEVDVSQAPQSGILTGEPLQEALVIGAAPAPLRELVEHTAYKGEDGVTLSMRGDVELRFGDGERAAQKWAAAAAVLADPKLTALSYIDVRVPARPAVGGTGAGATADSTATDPAVTDPVAPVTPTTTTATTPTTTVPTDTTTVAP
jgi:cell division protein FtsQ